MNLKGLFDAGLHPVGIVTGGLAVHVVEFLTNVLPDLAILEEWVQLDDFHHLLLARVQLVKVETNAVKSSENRRA